MPSALVILAAGAEEMEAVITVDVLRRGGVSAPQHYSGGGGYSRRPSPDYRKLNNKNTGRASRNPAYPNFNTNPNITQHFKP